jgi:hypothetical protein
MVLSQQYYFDSEVIPILFSTARGISPFISFRTIPDTIFLHILDKFHD